jgi:hypothetical protein
MQDSQPKPSRRGFFFGAAATGAAAAAVVAAARRARPPGRTRRPKPAPEKGGGYSLSEHVKRYYKTTRDLARSPSAPARPRFHFSTESFMLLTKKSSGPSRAPRRFRALCAEPVARPVQRAAHHGPPRLPAPLRPGRRRRHRRHAADAGQESQAAAPGPGRRQGKIEVKRTVCSHCSVGCAVDAVVENGVWVRQEPVFDSPINLGAHCAKGAALREHGHGEYRLRYPMKLVNGKYERISWDRRSTRSAPGCWNCARTAAPTRCTGSAPPSTTTSRPT